MIVEVIIFSAVGFVAGMYVTTQLSEWIEGRINQNKELLENMEKLDETKKDKDEQ